MKKLKFQSEEIQVREIRFFEDGADTTDKRGGANPLLRGANPKSVRRLPEAMRCDEDEM